MHFDSGAEEEAPSKEGSSYLDMLNAPAGASSSEDLSTVIADAPKKRGRKPGSSSKGVVDSGPKKRGRKPSADSGLKSL